MKELNRSARSAACNINISFVSSVFISVLFGRIAAVLPQPDINLITRILFLYSHQKVKESFAHFSFILLKSFNVKVFVSKLLS